MDLGEFKTRSISGIEDELIERFDIVAKRFVGTRSGLVKMLMRSAVASARCQWEQEASTEQFIRHTVNDTLKAFGIEIKR